MVIPWLKVCVHVPWMPPSCINNHQNDTVLKSGRPWHVIMYSHIYHLSPLNWYTSQDLPFWSIFTTAGKLWEICNDWIMDNGLNPWYANLRIAAYKWFKIFHNFGATFTYIGYSPQFATNLILGYLYFIQHKMSIAFFTYIQKGVLFQDTKPYIDIVFMMMRANSPDLSQQPLYQANTGDMNFMLLVAYSTTNITRIVRVRICNWYIYERDIASLVYSFPIDYEGRYQTLALRGYSIKAPLLESN